MFFIGIACMVKHVILNNPTQSMNLYKTYIKLNSTFLRGKSQKIVEYPDLISALISFDFHENIWPFYVIKGMFS